MCTSLQPHAPPRPRTPGRDNRRRRFTLGCVLLLLISAAAGLLLVLAAWDEEQMHGYAHFLGVQIVVGGLAFGVCRLLWFQCVRTLPAMVIAVAAAQAAANLPVLALLAAADLPPPLGLLVGGPLWGPLVVVLAKRLLDIDTAEAALPTVLCIGAYAFSFGMNAYRLLYG